MILISPKELKAAIPNLRDGLDSYRWLQDRVVKDSPFWESAEFRKRFNGFYKVRRNSAWRDAFYRLMAQAKQDRLGFGAILSRLHDATSRYEASFSSKLFATLNPKAPVIDSVVLRNVGLRLPTSQTKNRVQVIVQLHSTLVAEFARYLDSESGAMLVREFDHSYPDTQITNEKKLDLILWQIRS